MVTPRQPWRTGSDLVLISSGLISYEHAAGFVHALNTPDGMARKLTALGIAASVPTAGGLRTDGWRR